MSDKSQYFYDHNTNMISGDSYHVLSKNLTVYKRLFGTKVSGLINVDFLCHDYGVDT